MKTDLKSLGASLATNLGPLAPFLVAAALASAYFAAGSARVAATSFKAAQDTSTSKVSLEQQPITDVEALAAAQKLSKLAPATTVAVSGKFVVVSVSKPELFAEWMHALNEVQSLTKDVQWQAEDVCLASCDGGEAAKAYVTAVRRHLKVS